MEHPNFFHGGFLKNGLSLTSYFRSTELVGVDGVTFSLNRLTVPPGLQQTSGLSRWTTGRVDISVSHSRLSLDVDETRAHSQKKGFGFDVLGAPGAESLQIVNSSLSRSLTS